jgi:hypothetical protein
MSVDVRVELLYVIMWAANAEVVGPLGECRCGATSPGHCFMWVRVRVRSLLERVFKVIEMSDPAAKKKEEEGDAAADDTGAEDDDDDDDDKGGGDK